MLTLPSSVRVYLAADATDMRRSFDRLCSTVEGAFGFDITHGHLFVFINRRGDQAKCLFWDRSGLCILHNQLYSYCTSFGSRYVSCSLACWVSCSRRAIDESIPSAAVLLGQCLRFFVEPTVLRVRVRVDEPVFNPPYQCMPVDLESRRHLIFRQHAALAETIEA